MERRREPDHRQGGRWDPSLAGENVVVCTAWLVENTFLAVKFLDKAFISQQLLTEMVKSK